jgi:DNA-binding response OmpR family regulator
VPSVLIIEKDELVGIMLARALEAAGYEVIRAQDAREGLMKLYESYPDIIIINRGIPEIFGEDAFVRVRQASYLPLIVLGNSDDAAESLEMGADAFMTYPPSLRELVARVRNLLNRKLKSDNKNGGTGMNIDTLKNNPPTQDDNSLGYLTATEFRLASCLVLNKDKLIDYSRLIREVWEGKKVTRDTLHYYMRSLRRKLQSFFYNPIRIINYRGVGYRLEEVF